MIVLQARYYDGAYPRAGETIFVDEENVAVFEQAQFARRLDPPPGSGRAQKGAKHGTR